MKKTLFLLPLAMVAMAFTGCSSDDEVLDNGGYDFSKGGYVKMAINLPKEASTGMRAENDNFNDGLPAEYDVKKAILILFQGEEDKPDEATFHSAYDITSSISMVPNSDNQITCSSTKIVEKATSGPSTSNILYALVVLNDNGLLTVVSGNGLKIGTEDFTGTFATFSKKKVAFATVTADGLPMLNAALMSAQGGRVASAPTGAKCNVLVSLKDKVYPTEAAAQSNPGAEVYVERAVAKVTMNGKADELTDPNFSTNKINYMTKGWLLDVTNKKSYLVHQVKTDWNGYTSGLYASAENNYRFIGNNDVYTGAYRSYWAEDPNYSSYADDFTKITASDELSTNFGTDNPKYCMENTFDVANQNQNQTTRVVLSVELTPVASTMNTANADKTFYIINKERNKTYSSDKVVEYVGQACKDLGYVTDASAITAVRFTELDAKNEKTITGVTGTTLDDTQLANLKKKVFSVIEYKHGIAYYPIRIKHFGDDLTPWENGKGGVDASHIYPTADAEQNYLGRYGVLRNNWYNISVSSISGIGEPVIPDTPGTPDDELANYISVRIHILSWAKRDQNVEL